MFEKLAGSRTYILAAIAGVYAALIGTGVIENYEWVWGLLGAGAAASLRAGMVKAGK